MQNCCADRVSDVAGRRRERAALAIGNAGIGFDTLRDDPAVPGAVLEDLQRLGATGLQPQMVSDFP